VVFADTTRRPLYNLRQLTREVTMAHPLITVPGCTVDTSWSGRIAVLSVSGTLDMLSAAALQNSIDTALHDHPAALIVDLTKVDFLASAGMSVLIAASDAAATEVRFLLVAHGPTTARPLELTGVTEIIEMYTALTEALAEAETSA
jgi:anti-sigma B factor antagonist